ncbi:hypothetical protein M378DRAFT_159594 [Amanita muscaria Koide BX008]|uniref:Uncharacterized protein n=1 Tax=Amanita muscaria (strain Koide BX008) TaxID=946122 RepID=A0A0C2XCQ3_AMAMK|nr:hypothetical protein M378DRAFT_159594 [Amanita muscaria Koide BX008]
MIDVVQKFLSALPSPKLLQEIRIAVKPITPSLEGDLTMLESFEWSSLVETIRLSKGRSWTLWTVDWTGLDTKGPGLGLQ